jgi:hypothetical protein
MMCTRQTNAEAVCDQLLRNALFSRERIISTQADQQLLRAYALDEELVIADWHNHKGRIEKPLGNHA